MIENTSEFTQLTSEPIAGYHIYLKDGSNYCRQDDALGFVCDTGTPVHGFIWRLITLFTDSGAKVSWNTGPSYKVQFPTADPAGVPDIWFLFPNNA